MSIDTNTGGNGAGGTSSGTGAGASRRIGDGTGKEAGIHTSVEPSASTSSTSAPSRKSEVRASGKGDSRKTGADTEAGRGREIGTHSSTTSGDATGRSNAPRHEAKHSIKHKDKAEEWSSRGRAQLTGEAAQPRRHKTSALARLINNWWNRLFQAVYQGSFNDQESEYLEHETTRDYVWNTIGQGVWGFTFPLLTIIATQLAGTSEAGMLSTAFVAATLLMIVSNFGVRNYQASDIYGNVSFASYQVHRWITSVLAFIAGLFYCMLRGYEPYMFTISIGVYLYKIVEGLADVYEGRLQQADKLYLAGVSMTVRSVFVIVLFTLALLFLRNLAAACVAMAVGAIASLLLVSIPLAYFETDKSAPFKINEVGTLFRQCFPLFFSLFMFNLIDSMPKFAIENMLTYDDQFYFNVLYFAAQGNTTLSAVVYKPQLLRLADIWSNPKRRKRFDLIVIAMFAVIAGIAVVTGVFLDWIGIDLMSFIYGVDMSEYSTLFYAMTVAGAFNSSIDFIYAVVTVLRHQGSITIPSIVAFICSCIIPTLLIYFMGLAGAVWGYLIVMGVLLALLIREYVRIRGSISKEGRSPFK